VYIGQPPLYRLQLGKEVRWAYSDNQRDKAIKELKALAKAKRDKRAEKAEPEEEKPTKGRRRGAQPATNGPAGADGEDASLSTDEGTDDGKGGREPAISRYKGLAEMNAEQLWDTTLNPLTRTLKRVTLEDAEQADFAFDELMGTEVEGRKKWIMANASKAELDI
jgi:DNA gyrase subunit B